MGRAVRGRCARFGRRGIVSSPKFRGGASGDFRVDLFALRAALRSAQSRGPSTAASTRDRQGSPAQPAHPLPGLPQGFPRRDPRPFGHGDHGKRSRFAHRPGPPLRPLPSAASLNTRPTWILYKGASHKGGGAFPGSRPLPSSLAAASLPGRASSAGTQPLEGGVADPPPPEEQAPARSAPRKWRTAEAPPRRRGGACSSGAPERASERARRLLGTVVRSPRSAMVAAMLLLVVLLAGAEAGGGLYSREANQAAAASPSAAPPAEFRLVRLNQLWEKAQRVGLPAVRLAELHSDLRLQEKDELSWKKQKAAGLDEDGEREARLRRRLEVIMTKYGLSGKKERQQWETNHIKEGFAKDDLDDPRLEKLWNKAKSSGKFSDEELEKLWREFQHHKEKVHEYNILLETVSRTEDVHKNMINPVEDESIAKTELLHRKHSELKEQLHSINQGFERLRKVSHQGYDSASEFEEPRVIDLWDLAQSTNFTEKELESLREELKHFEAKVEKHHHYQKQLEISHQKLKHVEGTGDKEHLSQNKEKYTMLEEKTKELGYKVKKHLQHLSRRISRGLQHNEL